jgi:S-adenosylmethionine:tRNA ribosyltransferase-isomerase
MRTADFDFQLPPELIAQKPTAERDQSRLLVLDRSTGNIRHRRFPDLQEYLRDGDALVLNNTRVIPARLRGFNLKTHGEFEILLLEENSMNDWWVMLRPGKRARVGTQIQITPNQMPEAEALSSHSETSQGIAPGITAIVIDTNEEGHRRLQFSGTPNIFNHLDTLGEVPLPPYIQRKTKEKTSAVAPQNLNDNERYQTVFAHSAGSVAAPTAGLHFTESFLNTLTSRGVRICFVTLHVGLGTFAPVKAETLATHQMHSERYDLSEPAARVLNETKHKGHRIFAVGTTSVRVLESVAQQHGGRLAAATGRTNIFIHPPYQFRIVDALLTNFHLPRSTLLMLASAFASPNTTCGRETLLSAYGEAIDQRYRFFSYGDAMLIL